MGQPSSINKPTQLDNILLWAELKHPQRYGTTLKVLKNLLSLLQRIRGQTAHCVRAWHQVLPSHASCRRHLRLGSSGDGSINPTGNKRLMERNPCLENNHVGLISTTNTIFLYCMLARYQVLLIF